MSSKARPQVLYRMYDTAETLLYIGISMSFSARFTAHRADKPWWTEVVQMTLEHFETRAHAEKAEAAAIAAEDPLYNRALRAPHVRLAPKGEPTLQPSADEIARYAAVERELVESQTGMLDRTAALRHRQAVVVAARSAGLSKYRIAQVLGVGAPTVDSILRAADREK